MQEFLHAALRNKSFSLGAIITGLFVLIALLALFWTPYPVAELNIAARLQGLSAEHWLGTDHFGRDVLSMLMAGSGNSIAVALIAVGVGAGLGVPLGALAAARRGWIDEAVMRFNDFAFAFPALLSAVMITVPAR